MPIQESVIVGSLWFAVVFWVLRVISSNTTGLHASINSETCCMQWSTYVRLWFYVYNIYLIRICIFARNWQLITLHSQLCFTTPWFLVFAIHIHRNAAIPRYVFRPQQVPSACCRCSTVPSSRNPWESGEPVKKSGWPVEVGSLSHYLEGFDSQVVQDFFQKYEHVGLTGV